MQHMHEELVRQSKTLESISQSLQLLAKVEQSQIHINERLKDGGTKIGDHEKRLAELEAKMPGLVEVRRWVVGGILAGIGMMAIAVVKLVFIP